MSEISNQSAAPQLNGILETALYVADLERAAAFYEQLFGFARLLDEERMIALKVSQSPCQVLLLFLKGASTEGADVPGGHIPGHDGAGRVHFAFAVQESDIEVWRQRLKGQNIEIISEVRPPQGGLSLYFRDLDGHLAELAAPRIWQLD